MRIWERMTFAIASVSIATNESFRRIAIERGGMEPGRRDRGPLGPEARQLPPRARRPGPSRRRRAPCSATSA